MIGINKDSQKTKMILTKFYSHIENFLSIHDGNQNPKNDNDRSKPQKLARKNKGTLYGDMFNYFQNHLKEIITAAPLDLKSKQENMLTAVGYNNHDDNHKVQFRRFKTTMTNYYSSFFQEKIIENGSHISIGRWLSSSLGLSVCPFCNHNYTITINDYKGGIKAKPDFDHFFPKSEYPLVALSFYNLIPICNTCNKLKGNKEISHNPYDDSHPRPTFRLYGKNDKMELQLLGLGDNYNDIEISPESEYTKANLESCNITKLGLKQIYNHQKDYVQELMDKAQQYNKSSYEGLVNSFNGLGKTEAEIDRIIWSAYLDDHSKRPLSKLTHDLLIQLGIKNG
ncbi:hypothetical protein [Sphingobacterium yanglingense]|uniref:HNH endonuclease n=1 Tax=Sphingobacterium yanglingense TaxID=1437280 RepID=A0A4R6WJZ1_9SPHI|nr:hypothetical protein [Sphingobacterium yanglingense]TDQ79078.1 hypothetical protein CLV99_0510 [Sphingobacterium yanglingense]